MPCSAKIKSRNGSILGKLEKNLFDLKYHFAIPALVEVNGSVDAVENNKQYGKATTLLNRSVRSCSKHDLLQFIRFVRSSSSFSPNTHKTTYY